MKNALNTMDTRGTIEWLDGEELAPYEQNVEQAFGFLDVTQRPPRFRKSFVSFDARQLLVH